MKFLTSIISFLIESILIILAIIWHLKHPDQEDAIITLVTFCAAPILGVVTYFASKHSRPNLDFHHAIDNFRRYTRGLTSNNPPTIELGVTRIEQNWDLSWIYNLEVRNNSRTDAHKIKMHYLNIPPQTTIFGEVGAIEPILGNEIRQMKIEVRKRFVGTADAANEELKNSPDNFFDTFKINAEYVDEYQNKYGSIYNWKTKEIKYVKSKTFEYIRIVIACIALIILISGLCNYLQTEIQESIPNIKTKTIDSTQHKGLEKNQKKIPLKNNISKQTEERKIKTPIKSPQKDNKTPSINVKAENGGIATYGQIGDNTIVNNENKPEPKIEIIKSSMNEKVTTLPVRENFENSKLPNIKYNYPFLFKSTITIKYSAPQVLNGFGFLSGTIDVVLMTTDHEGMARGQKGIYYGKKYAAVLQPENGIYIFSAYTTKEIKNLDEVFILLK